MNTNRIFKTPKEIDSHIQSVDVTTENAITEAKEILDIYTPFINDTTVTFEYIVPNLQDFMIRILSIAKEYPYYVYKKNGHVIGYAYASKFNVREAYKFTALVSIYIDKKNQGVGIGNKLYTALFSQLKKQGYRTVYAIITSPNIPSEKFHEKMGFKNLAIFEKSGYKFNQWIDVKYMQLQLNEYDSNPKIII